MRVVGYMRSKMQPEPEQQVAYGVWRGGRWTWFDTNPPVKNGVGSPFRGAVCGLDGDALICLFYLPGQEGLPDDLRAKITNPEVLEQDSDLDYAVARVLLKKTLLQPDLRENVVGIPEGAAGGSVGFPLEGLIQLL